MKDDFDSVLEPDEIDSDRPDPEEPSTWPRAKQRADLEIDDLDWRDQHSAVEDASTEDEMDPTVAAADLGNSGVVAE